MSKKSVVTVHWADNTSDDKIHKWANRLGKGLSKNTSINNIDIDNQGAKDTRKWDKESILKAIQKYHAHYGKVPSSHDWLTAGFWPTRGTVVRHFGNWSDAIVEAGFPRPTSGGASLLNSLVLEELQHYEHPSPETN